MQPGLWIWQQWRRRGCLWWLWVARLWAAGLLRRCVAAKGKGSHGVGAALSQDGLGIVKRFCQGGFRLGEGAEVGDVVGLRR